MSDVKKLITDIVHLHQENIGAAKETTERALTIGVKLHQLKASLPHGEFLETLKTDAKAISERTARNYMTLASDRLIEERCFQLLEEKNSHGGKSATVADLAVVREEQFIPPELREQAKTELKEVDWNKLPVPVKQLVKGVNGRELTQLYQDYGAIRGNQAKVHHAPKALTVDEQLAAENATALAFITSLHNACADVCMDLESKEGIIGVRVAPKDLKDIRRQLARTNKLFAVALKLKSKSPKTKAVSKKKA